MKSWVRLEGGQITKVGFRKIVEKVFVMNNGLKMHASIVNEDGDQAICVIPLTPANEVVIARQFRCGPELVLDEIPGGAVDKGESPEQAARRELREEVGYDSDNFEYLGKAYVNAWENTVHHYYLARDCYKIESNNPEEFEEIEVDLQSISQLIQNAKQAKMTDVQAVFLAYDRFKELEEK